MNGDAPKFDAAGDGVEEQHATVFVAEGGCYFLAAFFDLFEESFERVGGANGFPVIFWEFMEGTCLAPQGSES